MPPSKQVVDRQKDAVSVVSSVQTHASAIRTALAEELTPYLQSSETLPDLELLLTLVGRAIETRASEMSSADMEHQTELADDGGYRKARDLAAGDLISSITSMRGMLEGVFGQAEIQVYGIKGTTPRDPNQLVAFALALASHLEKEPLPKPKFAATLDRLALAADLRAKVTPLQEALEHVAREVREAESTLVARDAAMDTFDRTFSRSAAALTALFRLAGQDELASRVRPSGRNPGRLAEPTEPTEAPTPADASC
jgi:hypothetical protein